MEKMTFWEANLAFEGYRKKEYSDWQKVQRLGYIMAISNSAKPSRIKPEMIVDLSSFEKEFNDQEQERFEPVKEQPTEDIEVTRKRLKAKALALKDII